MENANASRALRDHGDAVILPGLTIEALGRVQGSVLRDRDVGHILLIDDKESGGWRGRASPILRKYLADVRAGHVLSRVEHQRGGGRSPAINGRRLLDKQTNGISPSRRLPTFRDQSAVHRLTKYQGIFLILARIGDPSDLAK